MQMSRSTHAAASVIGQPVHFIQGEYTGQTVRATLSEIQQAKLGRKYARKDRRPLDPPPVVELKLYRVYNLGTDREVEVEIEDHGNSQNGGRICHIDLFPVPPPDSPEWSAYSGGRNRSRYHSQPASVGSSTQAYGQSFPTMGHQPYNFSSSTTLLSPTDIDLEMSYQNRPAYHVPSGSTIPNPLAPRAPFLPSPLEQTPNFDPTLRPSIPDDDVVGQFGGYTLRESLKCTHALSGTTFAEAVDIEYQGKNRLMLIFPDLAVKMTGTFVLRYRYFDIYARTESNGPEDLPILAECFGGSFRVYSTKDFPGLPPSTALTKHITRWGIRANLRDSERKRRRVGPPSPDISPHLTLGDLQPSPDVEPLLEDEWATYR
ncbi:hypothetical protein JAAARDRAFT_58465 [Jaapia argillacea MUCL 33604]|uniref:Velvet domain-containing protein n=1 Tax=Jaapia argillacea MUCL 33604 TaxID=933084 RepID=A0A067PT14_9AGAM|nr:hypothetical protein JAAARDRAFT_58465 [Jaapia argillacea MUCL 33604]